MIKNKAIKDSGHLKRTAVGDKNEKKKTKVTKVSCVSRQGNVVIIVHVYCCLLRSSVKHALPVRSNLPSYLYLYLSRNRHSQLSSQKLDMTLPLSKKGLQTS